MEAVLNRSMTGALLRGLQSLLDRRVKYKTNPWSRLRRAFLFTTPLFNHPKIFSASVSQQPVAISLLKSPPQQEPLPEVSCNADTAVKPSMGQEHGVITICTSKSTLDLTSAQYPDATRHSVSRPNAMNTSERSTPRLSQPFTRISARITRVNIRLTVVKE